MIKIHVGCGKRDFGPEWIHVDGEKYPHINHNDVWLNWYDENSVDVIYASHFLEYYDLERAGRLLENWYKCLKPGGILRLAVPDFEAMAKLYVSDPVKYPLNDLWGPLYGKMTMNNGYIYHKICYDFKTLSYLLELYGFNNIDRYDWRQTEHGHIDDHSQAYLPKMDKEKGNLISLNVEATK